MSAAPEFIRLGIAPTPAWLAPDGVERATDLEPKPFDETEFASRIERTRTSLTERGFDAVLVFRPSTVEYLCGHHTIETAPQPLLVTMEILVLTFRILRWEEDWPAEQPRRSLITRQMKMRSR